MSKRNRNPESPPDRDQDLVRAFQAGDGAAFDKLVIKHKDRIFSLCYWFLGDKEEANDSAQETFIKAYQSLRKFRFESALFTWLYRIAANTCKNRLKSVDYRQKKRMVYVNNPGETEDRKPITEIHDELCSPMKELEKKERMSLIQNAISSLPVDQRTVVVLRDIEGLSYEEVSNLIGLNLGTVKSKLSRARLQLRNKLRGMI
jgi:RNA polymerase sigma-70 factor (ECF subfamily)